MAKLKHVAQEKGTDCGVACICSLAGISQTRALKALNQDPDARSHRTRPGEIRAALATLNIRMHREVYCQDIDRIPAHVKQALLCVNFNEQEDTWHWVVLDRSDPQEPILDPQSKGRRAFRSTTRLASYFRIERMP